MVAFNHSNQKSGRLLELRFLQRESQHRQGSQQRVIEDREAWLISQVTGIDDESLLDRLVKAGFRSDNIMALPLLPIAMTAWASGSITPEERRYARQALVTSELHENGEAIQKFLEWLQKKPGESLWELWEDFIRATSCHRNPADFRLQGLSVCQTAQKVAVVSGGFLGFGNISLAEQAILDRTRRVYGLD